MKDLGAGSWWYVMVIIYSILLYINEFDITLGGWVFWKWWFAVSSTVIYDIDSIGLYDNDVID